MAPIIFFKLEDNGEATKPKNDLLGISSSLIFIMNCHHLSKTVKYVEVSWDFNSNVNLIDWIGMYQASIIFNFFKMLIL